MAKKTKLSKNDKRHGSYNAYSNLGCRCDPCTDANRVEHAKYLERHPEQVEKHRLREAARRKQKRSKGSGK